MNGNAEVTLKLYLKNLMKGGLDSAKKEVSENVEGMKEKLRGLKSSAVENLSAIKNEVPGLGKAIEFLENPIVLVTVGVLALGEAFNHARELAEEWEHGMAKINVTAGLGHEELAELSDKILDLGKNQTIPIQQLPDAFKKIIDSGIETETALATLDPTLKAAKAGFMDVGTAASTVSSIMKGTGIMDANKVWDIFFATVSKGNKNLEQMMEHLPRIIPLGTQVGFKLQEIAGAYADITSQGMPSRLASSGLEGLFKSLSDSKVLFGDKEKLGLKGLGINVYDKDQQIKPFLDIVEMIQKKTRGLSDLQKGMWFEQSGIDSSAIVALAAMTKDTGKLKEIIDATTNSTGALDKAFEHAKEGVDSWKIIGNNITAAFTKAGEPLAEVFAKLGDELLPIVNDILSGLPGVLDSIFGIAKDVWGTMKQIYNEIDNTLAPLGGVKEVFHNILGEISDITAGIKSMVDLMTDFNEKTLTKTLDYLSKIMFRTNPMQATDRNILEGHKVQLDDIMNPGKVNGQFGLNPFLAAGLNPVLPEKDLYTAVENKKPGAGALAHKPEKEKKERGTSLSGKAEQVRNITINNPIIGVSGDFVSNSQEFSNMGKRDFEKFMSDMFSRFMQNLETSYG